MTRSATGACFLLLLILTSCCQCVQQNAASNTDLCQNLNISMVQNTSTGMQILLTTARTHPTNDQVANLPNRHLPPECGTNNRRCAVHPFEYGKFTYYVIPSIGGFVTLSHNASYSMAHHNEEVLKSFKNVEERCNPTTAFYAGPEGNFRLYVVCLNLTSRPQGSLYVLEYSLSPSVEGVEWKKKASRSEPIYNTSTVSEVIYVRGQERCLYRDNLYFIDDSFILQFPADSQALDPQFQSSSDPLETCSSYQGIEYYGDDTLIIRCSNGQTVLYDSCAGVYDYQSPDDVPYPCMNWDTVVYRNRSQLTLELRNGKGTPPKTQQLPFSDLSYGKCVNQGDHPTFIASSADDGAIVIAPLNDNNVTKLTTGSCSGKAVCHRPVFFEDGQVFGVYDASISAFKFINLTLECHGEQVPIQISTPFVPDLISISQGKGEYSCGCSAVTVMDISNAKEDETIEEVQAIPHMYSATYILTIILVLAGVLILLGLSLGGAICIAVFCYKRRISKRNRAGSPESTPLRIQQAGSDQGGMSDVCTGVSAPHSAGMYHKRSVGDQYNQRTSDNDRKADLDAKAEQLVIANN